MSLAIIGGKFLDQLSFRKYKNGNIPIPLSGLIYLWYYFYKEKFYPNFYVMTYWSIVYRKGSRQNVYLPFIYQFSKLGVVSLASFTTYDYFFVSLWNQI